MDDNHKDNDDDMNNGQSPSHGRSEDGRFSPSVTQDDILDYLEEHRGAATGELAQSFSVTRQTIRRRCKELESKNEIRARKAGRTTFWQLVLEE